MGVPSKSIEALIEHSQYGSEPISFPSDLGNGFHLNSPKLMPYCNFILKSNRFPEMQRALELFETLNFFTLNIDGESYVNRALKSLDNDLKDDEFNQYLRKFISEEEAHSDLFREFLNRFGPKENFSGHLARLTSDRFDLLEFFTRVYIFEDIVSSINYLVMNDETVHPLVRSIHRMHYHDEKRHLAFGRINIKKLTQEKCWTEIERENFKTTTAAFYQVFWRDYFNRKVFVLAGVPDPIQMWFEYYTSISCAELKMSHSRRSINFLSALGLLDKDLRL